MVALSVISAVGICSFAGVKGTLIISEVIPFLVLAIGVDNIFILVNTFEKFSYIENSGDRLSETLRHVGASITLASFSESLAFLLGSLTRMPAVQAFSYYASAAIFIDFLLQLTCFCAVMVLDGQRAADNRVDCVPCVKLDKDETYDEMFKTKQATYSAIHDSSDTSLLIPKQTVNTSYSTTNFTNIDNQTQSAQYEQQGLLKSFVRNYYAPFLLKPLVKLVVVILFFGWLFTAIYFASSVQLGLDQRVALPKGSYVIDYFDDLNQYLAVGPPLYLVIKEGFNYSDVNSQNKICGIGGCYPDSLGNYFSAAPYTAGSTFSWIDGYLTFIANQQQCCQQRNGTICPPDDTNGCSNCWDLQPGPLNRPVPSEFYGEYFNYYLHKPNVSDSCTLLGLGYLSDVVPNNGSVLTVSRIRMYHSVLKTQQDYINALKVAYELTDATDLPVFPYRYQQYHSNFFFIFFINQS